MDFLSVVVPIFGLILIGWLLKAIGLFPSWLVKIVNDYVYYIGITVITFLACTIQASTCCSTPGYT